ncbi:chaperone NapD [Seminibacterium arietis]|uniref:Chaperone NapD n=1 Tax=Seminibacterium arietis TaxID=1173502 RepID=A0ABW3IAQ0_9PAST
MKKNTINYAKSWYVCGLVIQGRPEKIQQIKTALLQIPNTEVPAVDIDTGKLVVVMQSENQNKLANYMQQAQDIDGVINVSLVYHQQDE